MTPRSRIVLCVVGALVLTIVGLGALLCTLGFNVPLWTPNGVPSHNIAGSDVYAPRIISDVSGGAIVIWVNSPSPGYSDIFAQRVLSNGTIAPGWTASGVPLRNIAGSNAGFPTITFDGSGGAIVTWLDIRSYIYAQRVLSDGTIAPGWTASGVLLRGIAGSGAYALTITSDGSGGAIVTWVDVRSGVDDIYAQRVLSDGTIAPGWTANGVPLRNIAGAERGDPTITSTSDRSGGAIVTWMDNRTGVGDIYAQRVLSDGTIAPGWTANGVPLRGIAGSNALKPRITSDGSGGAIVTWRDGRSGGFGIYAQRVLSDGTIAPGWTANGVPLRGIAGSGAFDPTITSDGSGGAIITWQDQRSDVYDIYAQRVLSDGTIAPGWTANGVPLRSIAGSNSFGQTITSDGLGGAIVAWYDSGGQGIYAQRVLSDGTIAPGWTANGVSLRSSAGSSVFDPTITSDGSGGAIVTWQDRRSGGSDIYAQRVLSDGKIAPEWKANGVSLRSVPGSGAGDPTITSDGSGGKIVTWRDERSGGSGIYAQKVSTLDPTPTPTETPTGTRSR